jgi:two-component system response regulator (stage 0 sporulation protein F)
MDVKKGKKAPLMKTKILIADDEKALLNVITSYLKRRFEDKVDILETHDGSTAITIFEQRNVDLLIIDYKMPGLNGLQVMERISNTGKTVPVIFMAAFGDDNVQKKLNQMGVVRYLEKPFSMDELGNIIEKIIKPSGFHGELQGVDLCDFVMLLGSIRRSKLIWVRGDDDNWGKIYFESGKCVHAETVNQEGKDAFFEIISWNGGHFKDMPYIPPPKRTINEDPHLLILESLGLRDERIQESHFQGNKAFSSVAL